jgi:hypothetical protein
VAGLVLGNRGPIVEASGVADFNFWNKLVALFGAVNAVSDNGFPRLPRYLKAKVPSAATAGAGAIIYVTDATGGAEPFASDGGVWRRFSDRSVLS